MQSVSTRDIASPWRRLIRGQHSRQTWQAAGLGVTLLFLATGCATGRTVDGLYRDAANRFQVRPPAAGWVPQPLDGATLSYRAPALGAAMALHADCARPEPGGLRWVARHLYFGLKEARTTAQEPVRLHGAAGIRTHLRARLDETPVEVEGVTLRRAGCLYDFMYVAPPATFEQGRQAFEAFVGTWAPLAEP